MNYDGPVGGWHLCDVSAAKSEPDFAVRRGALAKRYDRTIQNPQMDNFSRAGTDQKYSAIHIST